MDRWSRSVEPWVGGGHLVLVLLREEDVGGGREVVDSQVVTRGSLQLRARAETALEGKRRYVKA